MTANLTNLPPVISVPPAELRVKIPSKEWHDCIEIWKLVSHKYLSLPSESFQTAMSKVDDNSISKFVVSYLRTATSPGQDTNLLSLTQDAVVRRYIYLLVHRDILYHNSSNLMSEWTILADFAKIYKRSPDLSNVLETAWEKNEAIIVQSLTNGYKQTLQEQLDKKDVSNLPTDQILSQQLLPLLRMSPSAGTLFVTGSDFTDSLIAAYPDSSPETKSTLLLLLYLCFLAPLQLFKPNQSLLRDHLYNLRTTVESTKNPILSDLVSDTPFLSKLRSLLSHTNDHRAASLIQSLETFRRPTAATKRKARPRSKLNKGKGRATSPDQTMHMHRLGLITQIQDLFPDLGSAFIAKLLDEYSDNLETVTAHLLEDDFPPYLQSLDRTENLPSTSHSFESPRAAQISLSPATTPPPPQSTTSKTLPERHNIHDNDALDRLAVPASNLHMGRREKPTTIDQPASARQASKAAILSALSAFDADDDEHDDTYDLSDVGGTVDNSNTTGAEDTDREEQRARSAAAKKAALSGPGLDDTAERALFEAYKSSSGVFARDAGTRRSDARRVLKEATGLTDEGVEGWAVMLGRDPGRLRKLEARFAVGNTVGGGLQQRELGRSAWRGDEEEGDTSGLSSGGEASGRGGRGGGGAGRRGGPRGGRGGGGSSDTPAARQRKEANKGSRANHNRRDQRAKKMARGGFPPAG